MAFYRNYNPAYVNSEEYTKKILNKIEASKLSMHMEFNTFPYNCKGFKQNINTSHLTLFFSEGCDKNILRGMVDMRMKDGYSLWSVPDEEKSVKIPHVHLIKETPSI